MVINDDGFVFVSKALLSKKNVHSHCHLLQNLHRLHRAQFPKSPSTKAESIPRDVPNRGWELGQQLLPGSPNGHLRWLVSAQGDGHLFGSLFRWRLPIQDQEVHLPDILLAHEHLLGLQAPKICLDTIHSPRKPCVSDAQNWSSPNKSGNWLRI